MDFKTKIKENEKLIVSRLQELVKIPSVLTEFDPNNIYPFGKNIFDALDYMLKIAKEDGFETVNCDNYAGHIEYGNKNGKLIGLLCHLDVVPEGDNWLYPPYDAKIVDGKMYGRGTGDDKGPTIAAYMALKFIKDANIKLKNNIRIILGTDEETGWRGVEYYFKHYPLPDMGFAPDADYPLIYGEKGRMTYDLSMEKFSDDVLERITGGERYNVVLEEVKAIVKKDLTKEFNEYVNSNGLSGKVEENNGKYILTLTGKASHAAFPEGGINAGTHMCNFLKDYTSNPLVHFIASYLHLGYYLNKMGLDYKDYEMGPITCNIGIMNIGEDSSRVTLDLRYPVRYDVKHMEDSFQRLCDNNHIIVTSHSKRDPHYVSPDDPLVTLLYEAYVKNTGDTVNKPFTIGGGTYAEMLPKGVAFGMKMPDEEELAHQRNEYINLDNLFTSILIYIDAILALGEIDA